MSEVTLVRGRWIVTGGSDDADVLNDGAVAIEGNTIREIGSYAALREKYSGASVLGSDSVAVMPGFINAHHHSNGASAAQHGVPDMLLEPWLLALRKMRGSDAYLNTLLSSTRLLASGVTSVVDVHGGRGTPQAFKDRACRALKAYSEAGIRVAFAPGIRTQCHLVGGIGDDENFRSALPEEIRVETDLDLPAPGDIGADDYLGIMGDLCREFANHPTIDIWYGPPGPQWVSDDLLYRIAEAAEHHDTGIQTHSEESYYEKLQGPRDYGKPVILHLHDLGVLGPRFSIAHGVWLSEPEIDVMAATGAAVSHNPSSNLRLRAGIAPLNAMLDAGMTVALGMDGNTINDDEDMFAEIRLALRLQRTPKLGTPAPTNKRILEMVTAGGAKLMRQENRLGRLAPGFAADLVLVDLKRITWPWVAPEVDPRDLIIMRARAGDVATVLVDGEVVLRNGQPTRVDLETVAAELRSAMAATPYPSEAAARAERLMPHVEAYYRGWEQPELDPYISYNSRS